MLKALAFVLVVMGFQVARADVLEIKRAGATCDPKLSACTLSVQINGEIDDSTVNQFQLLVDRIRTEAEISKSSFALVMVELNSRGGSVDAAMKIGRVVRKEEAAVSVDRGAVCLSACVLILAGGSFRGLDGTIGIHRPYFEVPTGGDTTNDTIKATYQRMLESIRSYLREMNVVDRLADDMLRVNPENIRVLNRSELSQYGLTEVDPVALEAFDLQRARSLGLNRQEYNHRKSLAESQCGGPASAGSNCYKNILKNGYLEQPDFSQFGRPRQ